MRSFQQRVLVGFNKLWIYFILSSLILCLSKTEKYLACPPKWRVELTVSEVLFSPVPEEIAYSFFNFLFDILELYKFGLWVSQLGNKDLVSDCIFTSQRKSHSIPDMVFLLTLNYHIGHPFLSAGRGGELSLESNFHKGGAWQDLMF